MKFIVIAILFLFQAYAAEEENDFVPVRYQKDYYQKSSECDAGRINELQAIQFRVTVPKKDIQERFDILVSEANSKFQQKIEFRKDHFFYPNLFSEKGHREFGLPQCDLESDCVVYFFVFDDGKLKNSKRHKFAIKLRNTSASEKPLVIDRYMESENFHSDLPGLIWEKELKASYDKKKKTLRVEISEDNIQSLRALGMELRLLIQYRKTSDQVGYTQVALEIPTPKTKVLSKDAKTLTITHQFKEHPTYLGVLLYGTLAARSYESKLELMVSPGLRSKCVGTAK